MPLNVHAKEWRPPSALSQELMNIRTGNNSPVEWPSREGSQPGGPATLGNSPATSSGGAVEEDELQFEEMFERAASGDGSARSTPRASLLMGPSPMPSPSASPQQHLSLLSITEGITPSPPSGNRPGATASAPCPAPTSAAVHVAAATQKPEATQPFDAPKTSSPNGNIDTATEAITIAHNEPIPTVVTHVETEASAAAASAAGGHRRLGPNDFELLRVVGQGAFGKVFQVRKRDTGEVFAMKVMRKDRILEKRHGEYVRAERDALTSVVHPYIVTLRYSFQTSQKLYLVLDFINGGHLFFQLYRAGTFDEPLAKLYCAELVLALTHLHSLGFVHRDLKPENVLLDSDGHVRVTDFGLAKGNMSDAEHQRSNSFIGTMEYMAPEIITGRGHGKAVDWWSVGVLLYEMLCGMPPFRAKSRTALQKLIATGKLKLPNYLSSDATNLLKGLLQKEAPKRLGFGPTGSRDVMNHAFFKNIDWKLLETRDMASPFKPTISTHDSVENFDKIWTDLPPHDSPCATPVESRSMEEESPFDGFTYCAPSMMAQAKAMIDKAILDKAMKSIAE